MFLFFFNLLLKNLRNLSAFCILQKKPLQWKDADDGKKYQRIIGSLKNVFCGTNTHNRMKIWQKIENR